MGIEHKVRHKRCAELRASRELRLKERRNQRRRNRSHKAIHGHRYKHNEAYAEDVKICKICGEVQ